MNEIQLRVSLRCCHSESATFGTESTLRPKIEFNDMLCEWIFSPSKCAGQFANEWTVSGTRTRPHCEILLLLRKLRTMSIRPFVISVPSNDVDDLRRRLREARWPASMPGIGWNMGMDIEYLHALMAYWCDTFDWRSIEAALNELPQFMIDTKSGPIHCLHFRGTGSSPVPIVLTHGWPSTFAELARLGRVLANPGEHGAMGARSFDVVIPSLPGYIFSRSPVELGSGVFKIANQWAEIMQSLGYRRFLAHGGDIGAGVSTALGLQHAESVLGVHLNYIPGSFAPFVAQTASLSAEENAFLASRTKWVDEEGGYSHVQGTKPDVLGPALNDSPVGLAAWIIDKYRSWSDCGGDPERCFTRDELLTVVSLYWFTRSMPSAIRLYWAMRRHPLKFAPGQRVEVPVAIARFPKELPTPPRSYIERGYNVVRWTDFPRGGHFAALEQTDAVAADIRSFTESLPSVRS
jgi:pimeloyl-ACP methyl ester carboxylesterase